MIRPVTLCAIALPLGLALALPASAALPPYFDRVEQIQTIISSDAVAERLDGRPIDSLDYERTGSDGGIKWEIDSDGCDIDVWLDPQTMAEGTVGKVTYQVRTPLERCD